MIATLKPTQPNGPLDALQAGFLAILPRIERHGQVVFRHLPSCKKEEAIQEMCCLAWKWYCRLVERGKNIAEFSSGLADFVARNIKRGRRLCGEEGARDVLSPFVQQRHGFAVKTHGRHGSVLADALTDNTATPPDEQAAFRIDFLDWQASYGERDLNIMDDLMRGERTGAVSRKFGLSPGRVSQLRRSYAEDWQRFQGESVEDSAVAAA